MTFKEFSEEFARLLAIYGRVNPNDDQAKEWFYSLGRVSKADLHAAIDRCRDTELEFPAAPAVLWSWIKTLEVVRKQRPSCERCLQGRIFYSRKTGVFSVRGHEIDYDFYAACDCPSGSIVADEMIRMWERKGINARVPQAARYSWLWQRFGGIDTANGGFGLSSEKLPASPKTQDDAGDRQGDPTPSTQDEINAIFGV